MVTRRLFPCLANTIPAGALLAKRATIKAFLGRDKSGPYTSLAPTDADELFDRVMPIRADESAVGAINRPLQIAGLIW